MTGIFIADMNSPGFSKTLEALNKATNEWTERAARGMCGWICSDCCINFPEGMPDTCPHGLQGCTDIIKRDKKHAGITGEQK